MNSVASFGSRFIFSHDVERSTVSYDIFVVSNNNVDGFRSMYKF